MDQLRQEFGGKCVDCGARDSGGGRPLHFSHVRPTGCLSNGRQGRGQRVRYFDIKQNPECYRLRCESCHKRYDREYWDRTKKAERDREVEERIQWAARLHQALAQEEPPF